MTGVQTCALPIWIEAKDMFLSIDLSDGDEQVEGREYLIQKGPKLRIAIGHFGMVITPGWQKQIALARHPNVYIESGGLTWLFHEEFYPYSSAISAILEARDICGIKKLMWGSDYPRTMAEITYGMGLRFIIQSERLSVEEKQAFLGNNAIQFYRFTHTERIEPIRHML